MKSLRNEENYDNPETADTSRTDKYDTSHTNRDDFIESVKYIKNSNYDEEYKEDNSQYQDGNKCLDNPETSYTFHVRKVLSTQQNKKNLLLNG